MFIVGLTGGIATGKSTVSKIFKELGCQVIDADQIAREGMRFLKSNRACDLAALGRPHVIGLQWNLFVARKLKGCEP